MIFVISVDGILSGIMTDTVFASVVGTNCIVTCYRRSEGFYLMVGQVKRNE